MSIPGNAFDRQHAQRDPDELHNDSRNLATSLVILRKEGVENSGSEEPLQSILLPCFSVRARKKSRRQISLMSMTNHAVGIWTCAQGIDSDITRGLFNTCAPVSAQLISPSASGAVLSTTDAYRNVHVTFSRSGHVIWVNEKTQRSPLQRPCGSIHSTKQRLSHDTIVTFHRFIATQVATSPLEELLDWKQETVIAQLCHGKSLNVASAISASLLDVYNFCPR